MAKQNTFNIENTDKIDFLSYFVDSEDANINDYTFQVSDENIAVVENGKVVFLQAGDVDVSATNKYTGDVYTIHLRLEKPAITINPKTINSIYTLFVIVLFMIGVSITFYLRKRND